MSNEYWGIGMHQDMNPQMENSIALPGAELIDYIPKLRESCEKVTDGLIMHSDEVQVEFVIGPSGSGKTTIAAQKGLWYEDTEVNTTASTIQEETRNPNHKIVTLHASLGTFIKEGKKRGLENESSRGAIVVPAGKNPLDLTHEQFAASGLIMQDTIDLVRDLFRDDPDHSIVFVVDTVALTSFDTGGVAVRRLASDENVNTVLVMPHLVIEKIAQDVRNFVAANPGDPAIYNLLQQYRIDFGVDLVDAVLANVFVQSSANEFGRVNALNNYYDQIKDKAEIGGRFGMKDQDIIQSLTRERFIADPDLRMKLYPEFFESRLEDLRLRDGRVTVVQNEPFPEGVVQVVHSHLNRVKQKEVPLSILQNTPSISEARKLILAA